MMNNFWSAFLEELHAIFSDSGRLLILVGAPILYALIYSTCYGAEVANEIPMVAVDEERSEGSQQLLEQLAASEQLQLVGQSNSMVEAREMLLQRKAEGIIYIPHGYDRALTRGEEGVIALYLDAGNFILYKGALEEVTTELLYAAASIEAERLIARGVPAATIPPRIEVIAYRETNLYNPRLGYGSFLLPGVLLLILQQTLLIGIGMRGKR